jgi:Ca2+-binding RTX toxin-like protein
MAEARRQRRSAVLTLALTMLVGSLAVIAVLAGRSKAAPRLQTEATGALTVSNSLDGRAILTVSGLAPGGSASGTVTIRNSGTVPGALVLSATGLHDTVGANGGVLSSALDLGLTDVTAGSDAPVWAGKLGSMPDQPLLTLNPGDRRTYRFDVSLADGGSPDAGSDGDNVLQGASTIVDYNWTVTQAGSSPCANKIRGNRRSNRLIGTSDGDRIAGLGGADLIKGRGGDDCANGGAGVDRVLGGGGNDKLTGGHGSDNLNGGSGNDVLRARDRSPDRVRCGPGNDRAVVDRHDRVRGCEVVRRPH